jgi:hypothetical protein
VGLGKGCARLDENCFDQFLCGLLAMIGSTDERRHRSVKIVNDLPQVIVDDRKPIGHGISGHRSSGLRVQQDN